MESRLVVTTASLVGRVSPRRTVRPRFAAPEYGAPKRVQYAMQHRNARATYRRMSRPDKEGLFLDILETPPFPDKDGWGVRFHAWLEEQAAEGRTLGEIALLLDLPDSGDEGLGNSWRTLDEYISWLIGHGYARVVRIEIIA